MIPASTAAPAVKFLLDELAKAKRKPLYVGVHGAQGAGKTSLCNFIVSLLSTKGIHAAALSIDDIYLTREQQKKLAADNKDNPFLQHRGYPGTHDVALGVCILDELAEPSGSVILPRYNKSAFEGLGDRLPEADWPIIDLPVEVVLFEGWMLGFEPVTKDKIEDPNLFVSNSALESYSALRDKMDVWIRMIPERLESVVDWRIDAEEKMKAQGRDGMTREQTKTYIESFLPAYRLWQSAFINEKPIKPTLDLVLAQNRALTLHVKHDSR